MIMDAKYKPYMTELQSAGYNDAGFKLQSKGINPISRRGFLEETAYIENDVRDEYEAVLKQIVEDHTPSEITEILNPELEAVEPVFCTDIRAVIDKVQKGADDFLK